MSARLVPLFPVAIVAAAALLSMRTAAAGCGSCGCAPGPAVCGGVVYEAEPAPEPVYPLQPTFHVELGPTYHAVVVAQDQVERRLQFARPHYYPYIPAWFGRRPWQAPPVAYAPYRAHHPDLVR